jgi:hypothetical protein
MFAPFAGCWQDRHAARLAMHAFRSLFYFAETTMTMTRITVRADVVFRIRDMGKYRRYSAACLISSARGSKSALSKYPRAIKMVVPEFW